MEYQLLFLEDTLNGTLSIPQNQSVGWYDLEVYENTSNSWTKKIMFFMLIIFHKLIQ